jgi:hypothetical protein
MDSVTEELRESLDTQVRRRHLKEDSDRLQVIEPKKKNKKQKNCVLFLFRCWRPKTFLHSRP